MAHRTEWCRLQFLRHIPRRFGTWVARLQEGESNAFKIMAQNSFCLQKPTFSPHPLFSPKKQLFTVTPYFGSARSIICPTSSSHILAPRPGRLSLFFTKGFANSRKAFFKMFASVLRVIVVFSFGHSQIRIPPFGNARKSGCERKSAPGCGLLFFLLPITPTNREAASHI